MEEIKNDSLICNRDYAIIQKIGGMQLRLCRLISGQHVLIEKLSFDPTGAIGKPFGIFEVGTNGKSLSAIDSSQKCSFPLKYQIECDNLNSNDINSENSSSIEQKHLLTDVDIATLKSEGISTEKLVSKLINGNSSFKDRSQFSKEKYLRKMTKKHSVLISRPNIRLICQSYYNKDPERTSHLRLDQLGLLLQLSAVHPCGCNIFVYENTLGILASAVMERLDNQGNCILLHRGDWPQSIPCIDAMNYRDKENFLPLRITTLLQPDLLKDEEESDQQKIERRQAITSQDNPNKVQSTIDSDYMIENEESSSIHNLLERREQRRIKEKRALEFLSKTFNEGEGMAEEEKLDGILLAGRTFDTVDVLKQIVNGLRLSGSVVIYSPIKQHLLKAWNFLRSTNSFVDIQIQSQLCRSLQILPNQTHPLMQQPVTGGYILSATKILSIEKIRK